MFVYDTQLKERVKEITEFKINKNDNEYKTQNKIGRYFEVDEQNKVIFICGEFKLIKINLENFKQI